MTLLLGPLSVYGATLAPGEIPELELPGRLIFEDADGAGQTRLAVGDLEPGIDFQLLQATGEPIPLDSVTSVAFTYRSLHGIGPLLGGTATIVDAAEGRCRYTLQVRDTAIADVYTAHAVLVWGSRPMTVPLVRPALLVISG